MDLNLHKVLYLYKTPSKFYIQPVEQPNEALIIDRQTCEINHNSMFSVGLLPANTTSCLIYGVIGIKHLLSCPYLIVITKATQIGLIDDQPIYCMDLAQVIPFNPDPVTYKDSKTEWNDHYVSMLEKVLSVPKFYFSYSYDLTNTMQRLDDLKTTREKTTDGNIAHYTYDKRFLWNSHLMVDFDRYPELTCRYRLPFILGFIRINSTPLGQKTSFTLISRRSALRAGTRYHCRGADYDGNVANFVETEQIFERYPNMKASYVQVRGSIPLIWRQTVGYAYTPKVEIDSNFDHKVPLNRHLYDLENHYGKITVVSLIDSKGRELKLNHEFEKHMKDLYIPARYVYFDFHKECSKMRWHRLSILLDLLQSELDAYGYFAIWGEKVVQRQGGVIRSNCIDSLDRTNVVQSMLAKKVLESQLLRFRFISSIGAGIDEYSEFIDVYKNTWADNADALSIQYTGTPALKTDFTRTGKRSKSGMAKDAMNSLTRYFTNNFYDFYRQDAIDLFLGNFEGYPSPLYKPNTLTSYTSTLPVTIVMLTLVALYFYLRY